MNRKRTQERITVMQAYVAGETVQRRHVGELSNWAIDYDPNWDWDTYDYRAKPKPREFWVNIYTHQGSYGAHSSPQKADKEALPDRTECIKVIEVIE